MPDDLAHQLATHLANNCRQLREGRGLSQAQMARVAGIPRPTWTHLESGAANPTLAVLVKVAAALQVRLEELIGPPRSVAKLYRSAELPVRKRGLVSVRRLLPDSLAGLELERMELPQGARMAGIPHTPGTREYLTCERGQLTLSLGERQFTLEPGDVAAFRGDQPHAYLNPGRSIAIAYSVIALTSADA